MDFTIVTPSYNYGRFIRECLESVAAQDGATFEHLVMDAGSTDDTASVVAGFSRASFFQEPDKGMSDGINKGFRRAKGEWVMWLNADDRLKPGALAEVKRFAELQNGMDVIFGGWDFIGEDGEFKKRMTLFPFRRRMLLQHGCYIGSTACFLRRATTVAQEQLLDDRFHYCMDGEYYARLVKLGKRFVYLPRILADFRLHGQSLSQRHLDSSDMSGILALQKQIAEVKAIRRAYGWQFGGVREFEDAADALLQFYFRLERGLLKSLYSSSASLPPP
ncbi:MAG: glycosyltransferase family 2 protein [Verrucomicrobiales bacterium]